MDTSDDDALYAYLDLLVQVSLLVVKLLVIVREHLEVVEGKLGLNTLLELQSLLNSQGISLGNDRHNVDNIGQLLQDDNINWLERVARRLNEEQTGVDAGIGDVTLSLGGKLLSQVRGVLVLDVLDDGIPTAVVVDKVAVAGGVDNVEPQTDTILLNEVRDALDLGGLANGLVRLQATLGVDEVRGEYGVDERRLAQASLACVNSVSFPLGLRDNTTPRQRAPLTNANNVELKSTLQQLALNLRRDAVETNMAARGDSGRSRHRD